MKTKCEANQVLMAHWLQAWTTLGRWQALNSRLSKETVAEDFGWAKRSSDRYRSRVSSAAASTAG